MVETQRKVTKRRRIATRARFNADRMVEDMTLRGWGNADLSRAAKVSPPTVMRFLRGQSQTARTCQLLAKALGYSVRRYYIGLKAVA